MISLQVGPQFLSSPGYFLLHAETQKVNLRVKQLASQAPRNWRTMNMEAMLETEVIGGRAGHPHITATEFW